MWSFATLESEPRPELMGILAAALVQRISDCNPQELSNTIWAFAKLRAPRALHSGADHADRKALSGTGRQAGRPKLLLGSRS